MKNRLASLLLAGLVAVVSTFAQTGPSLLENLGRGLVVLRTAPDTTVVTWRVLGTDPEGVAFNLYRSTNGGDAVRLNAEPITGATHYSDTTADPAQSHSYSVRPILYGTEESAGPAFTLAAGAPVQPYLRVPLQVPPPGVTTVGENYTYSPNDVSVGDLDGDGEYELIVKWDPSNAKDNSQSGHTGNVFIDSYKLDGTRLWRLDLGVNIRAGAHYTQFIVYDLDGDGIAEIACRTAPGSRDGLGNYVADPARFAGTRPEVDHTADFRNAGGYILGGPEFLTIFNGTTGAELASTNYNPPRHPDTLFPTTAQINAIWGDNYGNRIDRFNAAVAYLDGQRPSLLMARGYYTRAVVVAYDFRDGQLSERWIFDTNPNGGPDGEYGAWRGQGNHQVSIADIDGDGRDEIVFGAATIDDDGHGLYSTGLGHGDALHVSKMDPDRPGLQIFQPHESPASYGANGLSYIDAATGELIWGVQATGDIGRGVAFDVDPRYRGYEMWGSGSTGGMYTAQLATPNAVLGPRAVPIAAAKPAMNFGLWWDGDLLRELLDGVTITKWDWNASAPVPMLTAAGVASNNDTKATPALSADILGDWREEVIWRETGNNALRIYVTPHSTEQRLYTLMHDRQYRLAIAWQNVGYNQPPHPGFFLGHDMPAPPTPNIVTSLSVLLGPPAPVLTHVTEDTGASSTDLQTSDQTLILHGTAQAGATVNLIRAGAGPIGTTLADPQGQWTFDYTGTTLPAGPVSFLLSATDGAGNTGATSRPYVVTIDTSAPPAPTIAVVAAEGNDRYTISGTAMPQSVVTILLAGVGVIGTAQADADGQWILTYEAALGAAAHEFTAVATNPVGTDSAPSAPYSIDTSLPTPAIAGITEDTGISSTDGITSDNALVIHGTAAAGVTVNVLRFGSGTVATTTADENGHWSAALPAALPDGDYLFAASSSAGSSTSASSPLLAVTVDTVAPSVESVTRLVPTSPSGNTDTVVFRVEFSEPVGGVDASGLSLTATGGLTAQISNVVAADARTYEVTLTLMGEGTIRLDVVGAGTGITDPAGNTLSAGYEAGETFNRRLTGDGVWTRSTSGLWSDHANWADGIIGSGINTTADFSTVELTENVTVQLDSSRTVGNVIFGDTDIASAGSWTVSDGGATNTLTFATSAGTPTLSVLPMGLNAETRFETAIGGTQGLTKLGTGTAVLARSNPLSGTLTVSAGTLRLDADAELNVGNISVASGGARLHLNGGILNSVVLNSATPPANVATLTVNAGGGSALIIDGGTANFGTLSTSNSAGGLIRINGGTVTATTVNLPRSNDNSLAFGAGFVVAGGNVTVNGTAGIGTNNSYGVLSVEGGELLVKGNIRIGDLGGSSARGGVMRVTAGRLTNTDTVGGGLILAVRNPNTAHGWFTGGVSTLEVLTLGGPDNNAGAATLHFEGGEVYLGSGGLVKGGGAGMTTTVNLLGGRLGAKASWSSSVPLTLSAGGNIALHAADEAGAPHDMTLTGSLGGAGSFTKTGGGVLTLAAANTFSGSATVVEGTLRLDGSLANGNGGLTVASGGTLTGHGSSVKPVVLANGGLIAPDGTLAVAGLTWHGGGTVALELSAGERLAVSGALNKGEAGAYTFAFTADTPLAPGAWHTVGTFGSTDLTAADLTYTGLTGYLGAFDVSGGEIRFTAVPEGPAAAFQLWSVLQGLPSGQDGPADDADGDHRSNLLEFALGLDPHVIDGPDASTTTVDVGSAKYPAFVYTRRADLGGATLTVEISPDLDFDQLLSPVVVSETPQSDGTVLVVVRSSVPLTTEPDQFFRLSAALPSLNN